LQCALQASGSAISNVLETLPGLGVNPRSPRGNPQLQPGLQMRALQGYPRALHTRLDKGYGRTSYLVATFGPQTRPYASSRSVISRVRPAEFRPPGCRLVHFDHLCQPVTSVTRSRSVYHSDAPGLSTFSVGCLSEWGCSEYRTSGDAYRDTKHQTIWLHVSKFKWPIIKRIFGV
jgi:hypothetical protein